MSKRILPFALLAACLLIGNLAGEDEDTYDDVSGKKMRVVSFGSELTSVFYEDNGKKMELYAGMGYLSDAMPLPKGGVLKLYQERQLPVKNGAESEIGYVNIGNVPLVKGTEIIVLLSVPEDLGAEKIKGRSFKDSLAIHPAGTARVFNLSGKVVGVRAGKEALKLPVGGSGVMPWKAVAYNSVAYQIATQDEEKESWDLIESAECASPPGMRTFAFISETMIETTKTVTATTFLDAIPIRGSNRSDTP